MPMLPAGFQLDTDFLPDDEAEFFAAELYAHIDWQSDRVRVFGREHAIPRLHQWYAEDNIIYTWSGLAMRPQAFTQRLLEVRQRVQKRLGCEFNSVLANLYRNGKDSMGWHSDDEPELGDEPVIASVSLGAERDFQLRRRDRSGNTVTLSLPSGSLLVMSGRSQADWQHALPKRLRVNAPRINLTFRFLSSRQTNAGGTAGYPTV